MKTLPSFTAPVLWLVSFFFSMPLVEPYEVSRLLALGAGVLALGVLVLDPAAGTARMPRMGLAALVAAFFVWCGLTYFWSVSPFITLIAWGTLALLPLWFLIFALMPVSKAQVMLVLQLLVAAGAALSFWAVMQFTVFTGFLDINGALIHPFADPNNYAAVLNICFFTGLGLALHGEGRGRVLYLSACGLMVVAMLLVGSRAGLLLGAATLVIFALLLRPSLTPPQRKRGMLVMAGALIAALAAGLILIAQFDHERVTIFSRMESFVRMADDSGSIRLMLYSAALDLIRQAPWGGAGLGSFYLLYPAVRAPAENISAGLMVHSDPLQFWAEAGLPAIILLYAILIAVAGRFIAFVRAKTADHKQHILAAALFCALLTLAAHMHVSFHLFVASLLTVCGLVLGVWARMTVAEPVKTMPAKPVGAGCLIMAGLLLVVFQTCLFSEMHTRQAVAAMAAGDMARFGDKINQANREGFGLNPRPYVLAASIPLGLLQTTQGLSAEEKQALFDQTESLLDRGLERAPLHAGAYFSKAMLYSAMGRKKEAGVFIEKTLALDPRHPQAQAFQAR